MLPLKTLNCVEHSSETKSPKGFTLVELLVTLIIIGVLGSIALPSFLNQVWKARGAEAKSILGTINRAQQAYRLENGTMASSSTLLNAPVVQKFYHYQVNAINLNTATTITTTQQADLKAYGSRIEQNSDTFVQVICESIDLTSQGTTAPAPVSSSSCDVSYRVIE